MLIAMTWARRAWPSAALLLAACAATPPIQLGPEADPRAARRLLAEAAAAGPVRLVDNLPPGAGVLPRPTIEAEAARGVPNLAVRFAAPPTARGAARLLLLFDPPPDLPPIRACNAAALPAPAPDGARTRLQAVFCDGGTYLADASGTATGRDPDAMRRLVWRTTARLFPDDYPDTYGFDLFGNRVGIGGSFGF